MKIATTLELRKAIKVIYYELTKKGLTEEYLYNGVKQTIDLDILQTVKLLRQAGLIDSFEKTRADKFYVSYQSEYNTSDEQGEHVQLNQLTYGTYESFVSNTTFSQWDALTCAIYHERNRQEREEYQRIYKTSQIAQA